MPAGIAVDTREAVVRIATRDEMLERALFHRALKSTRFAQLLAVALRAAPQRARSRVASVVHTASRRRSTILRAGGSPLPWFALRSHPGRNARTTDPRHRIPAGESKGESRSTAVIERTLKSRCVGEDACGGDGSALVSAPSGPTSGNLRPGVHGPRHTQLSRVTDLPARGRF